MVSPPAYEGSGLLSAFVLRPSPPRRTGLFASSGLVFPPEPPPPPDPPQPPDPPDYSPEHICISGLLGLTLFLASVAEDLLTSTNRRRHLMNGVGQNPCGVVSWACPNRYISWAFASGPLFFNKVMGSKPINLNLKDFSLAFSPQPQPPISSACPVFLRLSLPFSGDFADGFPAPHVSPSSSSWRYFTAVCSLWDLGFSLSLASPFALVDSVVVVATVHATVESPSCASTAFSRYAGFMLLI